MKLLMHTCCAPCSVYCIDELREEGIEPTVYWYNPNIHPYTEYKQRRDTLKEYSKSINVKAIFEENYGLKEFTKNVICDLQNRCKNYCYRVRLEKTAKFAKENGYDAFTTTLLVSPYQNHEALKELGEELANKYGIEFVYRDFRIGFREGQQKARELGLYMQKYCGCIFSEEDRYAKQIEKDRKEVFKIDNNIYVIPKTKNTGILKFSKCNIETKAYIGINGLTKEKTEGDGKTPIGEFELGIILGTQDIVKNNNGLQYNKINKNMYWVDDFKSKYYNKLVDISKVEKDWASAEHLIDYPVQYEYLVEIKTNPKNIPEDGSAIFLHCEANKPTAGCVAINKQCMKEVIENIDKNTKIVICKGYNLYNIND